MSVLTGNEPVNESGNFAARQHYLTGSRRRGLLARDDFLRLRRVPLQPAIWHGFCLSAAACRFLAIYLYWAGVMERAQPRLKTHPCRIRAMEYFFSEYGSVDMQYGHIVTRTRDADPVYIVIHDIHHD